jgi:hypothetical protein
MNLQGKIQEKLYCKNCKRRTNHGYILKHEESGREDIQWMETHYITKCLGCDTVAFLREYGDESMQHYNDYGETENYTDIFVYPEEPIKVLDLREKLHDVKEFSNAPELIEMLYSQVVSSFNLKHYLLCAVGLRMIVEGVCKELKVSEGFLLNEQGIRKLDKQGNELVRTNLEGKINGLQANEIIVKKQADILHQIRELGNVSAHELEVPKRSTIKLGIEIIENMLHNIFDLEKYQLS